MCLTVWQNVTGCFDSSYNYIDCSIRVFSEDEYVAGVLETIRGGH